jgi:uncharacterized phage-like protein YoqJ
MRLLITGHREYKLVQNGYDIDWITNCIEDILLEVHPFKPLCYSGMADGIDLIFCKLCVDLKLPFIACVPFEEQNENMDSFHRNFREQLLSEAKEIKQVKNSWMVENIDTAIVVWDANKGGTHNVVQQLIEKKKNFFWINPVGKVVWKCFV